MSRDFEQEYREMMNSQIPDLWERIEQGVNASERANKVISLEAGAKERKVQTEYSEPTKKKPVNLYQLYAFAGAVACMALVMVGMPTVKRNMIAEQQAEEAGRAYIEEQQAKSSKPSSSVSVKENEAETEEQSFVHTKTMDISESTEDASDTVVKTEKVSSSKNKKSEVKSSSLTETVQETTETVLTESSEQTSEVSEQSEDKAEKKDKKSNKSIVVQAEKQEELSSVVAAANVTADGVVKESLSSTAAVTEKQEITADKGVTSSIKEMEADKNEASEQQEIAASIPENTETEDIESSEIKAVTVTGAEEQVASDIAEEVESYQGVKVKVTAKSKSKSDGKITYTVKVLEDPSKTFKKNKKLKMVSEKELSKNGKYIIDFAYSGEMTKKNVKIYKTVLVSDCVE